MLRLTILAILFAFAASPAGAADLKVVPAPAKQEATCGPLCQEYKSAHQTMPKATSIPLACINFKQARRDNVVLTLYGAHGSKVRELAKTAGPEGKFCFNRTLLSEAAGIVLCNGDDTVIIKAAQVAILREQGGMTPTQYACLMGKACKNYRGHTPPEVARLR